MGISLAELTALLRDAGRPSLPRSVLDIGAQNVYRCSKDEVVAFLLDHGQGLTADKVARYAEAFALGSMVHPQAGGINGSWLGDILTRLGVEYASLDIFHGYATTIADLNAYQLGPDRRERFDLVLNCGTTEHILNQFNCFKVMHDAARAGGLIYHALPMTGYLNHGYFSYHPKLFFELARANGYILRKVRFPGPAGAESVSDKLIAPCPDGEAGEDARRWSGAAVPTGGIAVLFEKGAPGEFRWPLETSTSAGDVALAAAPAAQPPDVVAYEARERAMASGPPPVLAEIEQLADEHRRLGITRPFPLNLERPLLEAYVDRYPERADLRDRLGRVKRLLVSSHPLLLYEADDPAVGDDVEAVALMPPGPRRLNGILAAYRRAAAAGALERFPPELEREALLAMGERHPDHSELWARLGVVMTRITTSTPLASTGPGQRRGG